MKHIVVFVGWVACNALLRKLNRMEDPERKKAERQFPSIVVEMRRLGTE